MGFYPIRQLFRPGPFQTTGQKDLILTLPAEDVVRVIRPVTDPAKDPLEVPDPFHRHHKPFPGQIPAGPLEAFDHRFYEPKTGIEKDAPSLALCRILVIGVFVFFQRFLDRYLLLLQIYYHLLADF